MKHRAFSNQGHLPNDLRLLDVMQFCDRSEVSAYGRFVIELRSGRKLLAWRRELACTVETHI
jgi:hypothetical protein